jgi:hypothetical protein
MRFCAAAWRGAALLPARRALPAAAALRRQAAGGASSPRGARSTAPCRALWERRPPPPAPEPAHRPADVFDGVLVLDRAPAAAWHAWRGALGGKQDRHARVIDASHAPDEEL